MEIREHGNKYIKDKYSDPKKAIYKCAVCGEPSLSSKTE